MQKSERFMIIVISAHFDIDVELFCLLNFKLWMIMMEFTGWQSVKHFTYYCKLLIRVDVGMRMVEQRKKTRNTKIMG